MTEQTDKLADALQGLEMFCNSPGDYEIITNELASLRDELRQQRAENKRLKAEQNKESAPATPKDRSKDWRYQESKAIMANPASTELDKAFAGTYISCADDLDSGLLERQIKKTTQDP
jgi:hypothetical protein